MSENIGKGFSLVMELEDPSRLPELMARLGSDSVKPRIQAALASLDYVHFARFLPLWDRGLLMIITEFDGAMPDYVMDFAAVLDDEFSLILSYMKGQPPLPVSRYPEQFWQYVDRNTGPKTTDPAQPNPLAYPDVFSDYPGLTALEIAGASREKVVPPQKPATPDTVDLGDVQAHTIRSYKATLACHLGFQFEAAKPARDMLAALAPHLTNAHTSRNQEVCITLGLTHAGLQALGLPQQTLERFPVAFREGPRLRSQRLGDVGRSDPGQWEVAGTKDGQTAVVHGVVSVYTNHSIDSGKTAAAINKGLAIVGKAMGSAAMVCAELPDGPQAVAMPVAKPKPGNSASPRAQVCFTCKAQAIGDQGEIHFGYRDGVGQPRFACVPSSGPATATPPTPAGDLLLGPEYRNSRGGYYLGELPAALALNGTYAALRIIHQDVTAFEKLLDDVQRQHQIDRELTAAKMVGRWRDGAPLSLYPTQANPTRFPKNREQTESPASTPAELLDAFDYNGQQYPHEAKLLKSHGIEPAPLIEDDEGRRCPFGAHARRLNPRGGMVLGVPWGRRVVRRGMPYGPKFERDKSEDKSPPRGLVGLFLCADLESQFEFLQHVWANQDLSAPGLRHTQDVFGSAQQIGTPFRFRPQENEAEISIMVPPLTQTVGSTYLFMPGIKGLNWIARAGWTADGGARAAPTPSPKTAARNNAMDKPKLDATDYRFLNDPYEKYKEFRRAGVGWVDVPYATHWVFSHKLVAEVNERKAEFLKPGKDRTGNKSGPFSVANNLKDGLFFMDPERHTQVRGVMNTIFGDAIAGAPELAEKTARELLGKALMKGQVDAIGEFAGKLASQVFFQLMGVPQDAWDLVDNWVRTALDGHRATMLPQLRAKGGTTTFAMRAYFRALQEGASKTAPNSILAGMQAATGCPASNVKMDPDEAMNTAVHMALGGYLSTEFLIGTGIYNLLRHPDQWQHLLHNRSLMPQAIDEMLRYDAPFQLADRWVNDRNEKGDAIEAIELGGEKLKSGTVIAVVYGSANRDETVFDNPDEFDISRSLRKGAYDPTPNLGFGDGVHRCIGEWLARPVTAAAINALLDLAPTARIGEVGPWAADPYFRSLTRLQLLLR